MNASYKDVFDDYAETRLSPKSMLFFQSYRAPQRAQTEMDDELTPWSDAIGPRFLSNANKLAESQKLVPKKRTISETQSSFYKVPKREKSVQNFTTATEASKDPENVETIETTEPVENVIDTTVDSVQVEIPKLPQPVVVSQNETPKSGKPLNFTIIGNNIEEKKPVEKLPRMMAANEIRSYGTSTSWLPNFSVPPANSEFKRGLIVQKEVASRSNKFWLGGTKISHIASEHASVDIKNRTFTHHFENIHHKFHTDVSLSFHETIVGSPEPSQHVQNVKMTRNESRKKGLFEAGPLNGIKTELNDFQKKLKGFGKYNFEKKCKHAVEKLFTKKKDIDGANGSATNIKLKLEILRKMNREESDVGKTKSCKPTLVRGAREKTANVPYKTSYDNDISCYHTEDSMEGEKPQTPTNFKERKKNAFSVAQQFMTEGDYEKHHSMEPRVPEKSSPGLFRIQSPLIHGSPVLQAKKSDSIDQFSLDKGNTSYGKIIKRFADKKFFQAYGTAEGKRPVAVASSMIKSQAGVSKYVVYQEKQTSNKLIRKRKNSKVITRNQEFSPIKELLKVDKT